MREEARCLLAQAGEVEPGERVWVARARARDTQVAWLTLALRCDGAVFERIVSISYGPSRVRGALEDGASPAARRSVETLPRALRDPAERAVEAQRACGYDSVELTRIELAEERVVEVRYHRRDAPRRTVWLGTAPPRVLAADTHRPLVVLPTLSLPSRDELLAISAVVVWFGWMGWVVLGR